MTPPTEHRIVELKAMWVLGVEGIVRNGGDVGDLWEPGFVSRQKEIRPLAVIPNRYYGVTSGTEEQRYLAGMVVDPPEEPPEGLTLREIPAGHYVEFEGSFEDWWMQEGPHWVHDTWLPESPYIHNPDVSIRDFVIHGVEGRVTFCVPIIEKPRT